MPQTRVPELDDGHKSQHVVTQVSTGADQNGQPQVVLQVDHQMHVASVCHFSYIIRQPSTSLAAPVQPATLSKPAGA